MKFFLLGLPGSGKSYWAKEISILSNLTFIDLDQEIEEFSHESISNIFKNKGEEHFRLIENQVLTNICNRKDNFIMACGGGTPCFHDNLQIIKKNGKSIYLRSAINHILKNLNKHNEVNKRPLFSEKESELGDKITKLLKNRSHYYNKADYIIDIDRQKNSEIKNQLMIVIRY